MEGRSNDSCLFGEGRTGILFSVEQARRALPYVARIVEDASDAYREVQACRSKLQVVRDLVEAERLAGRRDAALVKLNRAIDECNAVGAELVNVAEGVIQFPASIAGRDVSLVWRLGQSPASVWVNLETSALASPGPMHPSTV